MNNVLLYLGGLLVVALAALFAVPHFIDWNGYRGVFEEEATKVLGRDVRVGGAVNVRLLPTPFVSFEKVRLADPTGQTGEPFVRAENFRMRLSGPALLRGVLEANEVELNKPVLTLALDKNGSGNWSSLKIRAGALPFVPNDVTLRSVRINDGTVTLYGADGRPIAKATAVDGELSSNSMRGPFNFKGTANWSGAPREVRLATTEPDADGRFFLKAQIRDLTTDAKYMLDAQVADLAAKPHLAGKLTGTFPLLSPDDKKADTSDIQVPLMDVSAAIAADTAGARIDDLSMSIQNAAEPQLITGKASTAWGSGARFDIALKSKWLDLDRLAGAGQGAATFARIRHLGLSVLRTLAGNGSAVAKLDIDQVKLGGETTGSMRVNAERRGAAVSLRELRAGLPGGARLDLSGDMKDAGGNVSFSGAGFIHGTNLARLLTWAARSGADLDIKADGPFSAEGRVLIADNRFELTEASADIGGHPFTGDIAVSGEERRKVSVTLEAARIDTSELFPKTAATLERNLRQALAFDGSKPQAANTETEKKPVEDSDISVRVLAGELKHGDATYKDVDVTVGLDNDRIRIPSATFTTAGGLVARIDARFATEQNRPKGTLAYDFLARTPDSVRDLANLTGIADLIPADRLRHTNSAKLAGLLRLGLRNADAADLTLDGLIEGARVQGNAEFDGGLRRWRQAPSRTRLTAQGENLDTLLSAFGIDTSRNRPRAPGSAELVVATSGKLGDGTTAIVDMTAPGFNAAMKGAIGLADNDSLSITAGVDLKAASARDAFEIAGLSLADGADAIPLKGKIYLTRNGDGWTLAAQRLRAGETTLDATAAFTNKAGEAPTVSAAIEADTITVAGLLSAVSNATPPPQADGVDATTPASPQSIWSGGLFDLAALQPRIGDVTVRFGALAIDRGIAVRDGIMKIALAPGKIAVSDLKGTAAGGAVDGNFALTKAPSGTAFNGTLRVSGADLKLLSPNAKGKVTLEAKAAAQAQSPAGLIAVLNGDGHIAFDDVAFEAPAPSMGLAIVTAVLDEKVANNADAIADEIEKSVHDTSAVIGATSVPFKITDGVFNLAPIRLQSSKSSATNTTTADLSTMALDSAWKLATEMPPLMPLSMPVPGYTPRAPKGPLPPISIVYTGKLGDIAGLDIDVDAEDMQRELAVQVMERNVDKLERIRLLDEHRAKVERERRKAAEDARIAAEKAAAEKAAAEKAPATHATGAVVPNSGTDQPANPIANPGTGAPNPDASSPNATNPDATETVPLNRPPMAAPEPQSSTGEPADIASPPEPAETRDAPRPRKRVARPTEARRTTSDDIMRSLGGYP